MSRLRRPVLCCWAVCLCALAGGAPARAALLDPTQLTISSPGAGQPQVAITPSGWTLVVWTTSGREVRGAWRAPGGRFRGEVTLARGILGPHGLVATTDGKVVLTHQTYTNRNADEVRTILLDEGASTGPTQLVAGPGVNPTSWAVADARGGAVVVAPSSDGLWAVSRSAGQPFGPPERLDAGILLYPVAASNAAGDIAVAYLTADRKQRLVERPAGAIRFGAPSSPPVPGSFAPRVAVTDAGDVAISAAGSGQPVVGPASTGTVLAVRPRGGQFATQPLSDSGFPGTLLPAPGNRLTVFDAITGDGPGVTVRSRDRAPDGGFTAPVAITPPNVCTDVAVTTPSDDIVVAFSAACLRPVDGGFIAVTERPAGGVFSPPLPISAKRSNLPVAAVSPSGALAIAWQHRPGDDTEHDVIQAAVRDGSAELGLVGGAEATASAAAGTLGVVLGCAGLHDCRGTVEVRPPAGVARAASAGRHRVVLARGRTRGYRLHVPRAVLRGRTQARLVFRMSRVRRSVATRTVTVRLRR